MFFVHSILQEVKFHLVGNCMFFHPIFAVRFPANPYQTVEVVFETLDIENTLDRFLCLYCFLFLSEAFHFF